MRAHRSTERHRIDQRLGRALAALAGVRQHRVGRVPEQRDDALAPERHRVAVEDLVDTHVGGPDVTARTTPQSVATCASESPPDRPGRRARPAPPPARAPYTTGRRATILGPPITSGGERPHASPRWRPSGAPRPAPSSEHTDMSPWRRCIHWRRPQVKLAHTRQLASVSK